jgi:hypothetical protein
MTNVVTRVFSASHATRCDATVVCHLTRLSLIVVRKGDGKVVPVAVRQSRLRFRLAALVLLVAALAGCTTGTGTGKGGSSSAQPFARDTSSPPGSLHRLHPLAPGPRLVRPAVTRRS